MVATWSWTGVADDNTVRSNHFEHGRGGVASAPTTRTAWLSSFDNRGTATVGRALAR